MITTKTYKQLEPVLMDKTGEKIDEPYYVIHNPKGGNITVLLPGKNGIEFNKTYGHFHTYIGTETYHCLFGHGLLLLQRNDDEGQCKEFRVVSMKPGVSFEIPSGYGHALVNTGQSFLANIDNAPQDPDSHDYESVTSKQGLVYYVIEKKGEISFEKNPNYVYHPQISME